MSEVKKDGASWYEYLLQVHNTYISFSRQGIYLLSFYFITILIIMMIKLPAPPPLLDANNTDNRNNAGCADYVKAD